MSANLSALWTIVQFFVVLVMVCAAFAALSLIAAGWLTGNRDWSRRGFNMLVRVVVAAVLVTVIALIIQLPHQKYVNRRPPAWQPWPNFPQDWANAIEWVVAMLKWGSLVLIIACGVGGIGMVAGGRAAANMNWSRYGQEMIQVSLLLAVVYGAVYQIIIAFV